ncbi:MAG TPA: peptidoglycan-binding protein [Herpetosiphonaceae bacterium]
MVMHKRFGYLVFIVVLLVPWLMPRASHAEWPTYQLGDSGPDVLAIQYSLHAAGAQEVPTDGYFGLETETVIKEFQANEGLPADGIVGPEIWQALLVPVGLKSEGPEVLAAQHLLVAKHGYSLAIDGYFGAAMYDAVLDFQAANGLTPDGFMEKDTWSLVVSIPGLPATATIGPSSTATTATATTATASPTPCPTPTGTATTTATATTATATTATATTATARTITAVATAPADFGADMAQIAATPCATVTTTATATTTSTTTTPTETRTTTPTGTRTVTPSPTRAPTASPTRQPTPTPRPCNNMSPAEIANEIKKNSGISLLDFHISGVQDKATAQLNINHTALGDPAYRSKYGGAPGGTIHLKTRMLCGMLRLAKDYGYSFRVTEIAGGAHSKFSRHYAGLAFDIDIINGVGVSRTNKYYQTFMSRCRALGATEVLGPGDAGHSTHLHCAWDR